MKFLITARNKDSYYALETEKRVQLAMESLAWVDRSLKAGKCKEIFFASGLNDAVGIWEIASSEDGARIAMENPAFAFQDVKIEPLTEWEVAKEAFADHIRNLAKKK